MAEIQKISRVTFRELTDEEAVQKYGRSFVCVGARPVKGTVLQDQPSLTLQLAGTAQSKEHRRHYPRKA